MKWFGKFTLGATPRSTPWKGFFVCLHSIAPLLANKQYDRIVRESIHAFCSTEICYRGDSGDFKVVLLCLIVNVLNELLKRWGILTERYDIICYILKVLCSPNAHAHLK